MSWSMHNDNKKKYILILGKSPKYGVDDKTLTANKKYLLDFTEQQKQLCIIMW